MALQSLVRTLARSPLTEELLAKLDKQHVLKLTGAPRLPKGLVASALAQKVSRVLCVVTATLEEAGRWTAQLETMGWDTAQFYPTTEAAPYEPNYLGEMTWGQMQVLADLVPIANAADGEEATLAIVTTQRALQPHLPPKAVFRDRSLTVTPGSEWESSEFDRHLTAMGYDRVTLVESEGQWSRRGDIVDIFPVAADLPVRLEFFGDELEKLREFEPASQRPLDKLEKLALTPTSFNEAIRENLEALGVEFDPGQPELLAMYLGVAFDQPASVLDYLPEGSIVVVDEPDACRGHADRWVEHATDEFARKREQHPDIEPLHRSFDDCFTASEQHFDRLELTELVTEDGGLNLSSRRIPTAPHQFAKLAEVLREERERRFNTFLISAQPSRSVALLQEHDCPAQFLSNPKDFPAVDRLQTQRTPVALKYAGQAELEGFILPSFRLVAVTDREFFGQHVLATPSYVRKRRRAVSKTVDLDKLKPKDFVVHKDHGIGQFLQLESLTIDHETREYLVIQYADGTLRIAADQVNTLSRYRKTSEGQPQLHKMSGKAWQNAKTKARKAIKKVAVDLLKLYAQRAKQSGFAFPGDSPWQQELEDSFPYQPTPDQLKAVQDIKQDMESDRPMDRLVCGDVGFGKTEVAVRAIFKAITSGKQVALLAPTTVLTQQHYHTLKERFAPYPIEVGLLNRFRTSNERKQILQRLETGELDLIVGTQQILGKSVKFHDLGLMVVDEEQRFGVNQKEKIKALKTELDVLTLSATPIPRTLYMSISGIREMSLITTPPPSRRPIATHVMPFDLDTIHSAISQELDRGGQVFYVVPRVEGIEEVSTKIREMVPTARLAIAHGQMEPAELESIVLGFSSGNADVLVCTTIVESGLDIPRVNTILIEDAQKFGLAQLYQLRGRVGRSGIQAHAWLFYPAKRELTETAHKRLRALQEFSQLGSGYQLAMRDMEIRGIGNLLGAEQSGQVNTIGFDLYVQMLQEEICEIQGQEIPKVDNTQIDLKITAFIPSDYMPDADRKMAAYRNVATASSRAELRQIAANWVEIYGQLPKGAVQLLSVMELKQVAKQLGFSRIKPDGKQHVVLETPMEEPAWKLLAEHLPKHLKKRFVYSSGKVTVRGLGVVPAQKQLQSLIEWLDGIQAGLDKAGKEKAAVENVEEVAALLEV